jgi:hypothetical protein
MKLRENSSLGIPFLIVSLPVIFRSKTLRSYLDTENVDNVRISAVPSTQISLSEPAVKYVGNGVLSKLELSVGLSHITARSFGLSLNSDWVFVLEDDAIVLDNSKLSEAISDAVSFFCSDDPVAISFFPGQYGVFRKVRKSKKYLRVLRVPDYSVATLYSRQALVTSNKLIEAQIGPLPDWPKVLRQHLKWFAVSDFLVDHPRVDDPGSPSYLRQERNITRMAQKKITVRRFKIIVKYLMFVAIKPISKPYVGGTIETEKLRSRVLWF